MINRETIRRFGLEFTGRFYGTYMAVVSDNSEFEDRGMLTVQPLDISGSTSTYIKAYQKGVASKGMGMHWVPKKGEVVMIEFRRGSGQHCYWDGSFYAKGEKPKGLTEDDIAFTFPDGTVIKNNSKTNLLSIAHKDGWKLDIGSDSISIGKDKPLALTQQGFKYNGDYLLKGPDVKAQLSAIGNMIDILSKGLSSIAPPIDAAIQPLLSKFRVEIANLYTT